MAPRTNTHHSAVQFIAEYIADPDRVRAALLLVLAMSSSEGQSSQERKETESR